MFIAGRIAVIRPEVLSKDQCDGQLLFCTGGAGCGPNAADSSVRAVSLFNGECVLRKRRDILGLLKPELLPEYARLHLSQVRPLDSMVTKEPLFSGYCFLPDGRYTTGVPLSDELEVREYIDIQRDYQHKVMICDRDDFCVFEMVEGKFTYPTQEILDAHRENQEPNGMELKQ
jgi:hypothetical protein